MKPRKILLSLLLLLPAVLWAAKPGGPRVCLETTKGNIVIELFNDTPIHTHNFLRLVKSGYYDGLLFHRVIKDFMIQGGDPDSRNAAPGVLLGEGGPDSTLTPEISVHHYHVRGALAMAREGDEVNPERRSSASQFYIVYGTTWKEDQLLALREETAAQSGLNVPTTEDMILDYRETGGTPHLDGLYTVFGQVLTGMRVVEAIQKVETDKNDRPKDDVRIVRAYIVEEKK